MPHSVASLIPQIVGEYDRNPGEYFWTEGLQWHNGYLYESTGSDPKPSGGGETPPSRLQKLKLEGGQGTAKGTVRIEEFYELPEKYYGEGLARAGDKLYQLTERSAAVFEYDPDAISKPNELKHVTTKLQERWGLCYDGEQFFLSNGSDTIWIYQTLEHVVQDKRAGKITVTIGNDEAYNLNDLEYVSGYIYAAIRLGDGSNLIYQIDPKTGIVKAQIDAANLRKKLKDKSNAAELNGIAYGGTDPKDNQDVFWVTGKMWSKIFEVKFVPKKDET